MVGYWDSHETCRFANHAYQAWFNKSPVELIGTPLRKLLGPLYDLNLPHIQGVLRGQPQLFERRIPLPDGTGYRDSLATYTPDISDGVVRGFIVQVIDIGFAKTRISWRGTVPDTMEEPGEPDHQCGDLLTVCAWCRSLRDESGNWVHFESFIAAHTGSRFSHGICSACYQRNSV
jgi:hypothetical protein